ncbi:fatty acid desaturase-domain-containing protein [Mycena albidolilacea]|uniref:Fatty acid desaturase-domain-containing protein n=1 Tax=Mycena albidolilacea TaxID=1033008 RepID=A0AAD6ZYB0_9AGAR|nr:fatty acid desaturase-domain-containing protein [Mycena albidolilacea]
MQESAKVNRIQTAEPQDENLRIAFKEALAISNRHKGKSNLWGSLTILSNYVVIAGCIAVSEYSAKCLNRGAGWGIYSLMTLVISSRLRAFEHMVHEASHNNLFTLPRAHEWFEFTYAFPVFRTLHVEHHKYLGDPVRDSDVVRLIDYGFISDTPMSASRKTWLILGLPWTGWFQYEYINTLFTEFWMDSSRYPSKLIYWIVVLSAVHFSDRWTEFGWYYVIPWLGIFPILRWWAELGEHVGMDMTKDFGNSRTNDGFWQRWFFYPLNDGLHAAHHLNSQVPCYRLRRAQAELMAESTAFREKNVLANSMWETYSQIYTRPTIIKERVEGVRAERNNEHQM